MGCSDGRLMKRRRNEKMEERETRVLVVSLGDCTCLLIRVPDQESVAEQNAKSTTV